MSQVMQAATETAPSAELELYPIEATEFEIPIKAPNHSKLLIHRMRKPSDGTLYERDNSAPMEAEAVSDDEQVITSGEDATASANAVAWDKEVLAVKGYRSRTEPESAADDWREIERDEKGRLQGFALKIPTEHKSAAFRGMFVSVCKIEGGGEGAGFVLDNDRVCVRQTFGDPDAPHYVLTHTLDSPTEEIRRLYKQGSKTSLIGGSRRGRVRVRTSMRVKAEAYRKSNPAIEGATVNDPLLLSAAFQAQVMDCVMRSLSAELSD